MGDLPLAADRTARWRTLPLLHQRSLRPPGSGPETPDISSAACTRLMRNEQYAARADLLAALGECQMQLGQYREARATLETATKRDPASVGAWLSHAKAALQLNDAKRAELSLRQALTIAPDNSA